MYPYTPAGKEEEKPLRSRLGALSFFRLSLQGIQIGGLNRSVLLVFLASYLLARPATADPVIYFTASPADGTPGPTETFMGISYATEIEWSVSQLEINDPNLYGGNYRSYLVPDAGNFNTQSAWDFGQLVTETAVGSISGESQPQSTILSGPTAIYAPTPASNDTVVFGYLGPNGVQDTPPLSANSTYVGEDAYTVGLGANTVAETAAGFFSEPADSKITLTLAGTYTSTGDAELEGQQIVINGSGTFVTPDLRIAGNVNVTSGTLQGTSTIIDNGLNLANGVSLITGTAPTSSTLTLTGGSSILNASNYVAVGASASGPSTLDLENGSMANVGTIYLGYNVPNAQGNLTVNNATLTSTGILYAGYNTSDDAVVRVTGGGQLTDQGAIIGYGSQSAASVTVDGSGSKWTIPSDPSYGYIAIGYSGTGGNSLTVSNSGQVTSASYLVIGGFSGPDSTGSGSMTISSGGQVTSATSPPSGNTLGAAVGFGPNSTGTVLITGANSKWTVDQRLDLGYSSGSNGTVTVQAGGALEVDSDIIRVGDAQGSTGTLIFDGTGGTPTLTFTPGSSGQLLIGDAGTGNFKVQGGAQISNTSSVVIGNQSSALGYASVAGANSSWTITGNLIIGENGTGSLSIADGDTVTVQQGSGPNANGIELGENDGSTGTITVSDAGSSVTTPLLVIGDSGVGEFTVQNGATLTATATALGFSTGGFGTLTVDGGGQTGTSASLGNAVVGVDGTGMLNIKDGATVTATVLGVAVGPNATESVDANGSIVLTGNNSKLTVNGDADVGDGTNNYGIISISSGAFFTANNVSLGQNDGYGRLMLQGGGSTATINGDLNVDADSTSSVAVNVGANSTLTDVGNVIINVPDQPNLNIPNAIVAGSVALWNISGNLTVGQTANGELYVQGAGHENVTGNLSIAQSAGSIARVVVSGSGSQLTVAGTTSIGSGNGALLFQNGGQGDLTGTVNVTYGSFQVGSFSDPSNAGTFVQTEEVDVGGGSQSASVNVLNGATLDADSLVDIEANGTVTVNGSLEPNSDTGQVQPSLSAESVNVGSQGTLVASSGGIVNIVGQLTVQDGATVRVTPGSVITALGGIYLAKGENVHGGGGVINYGGSLTGGGTVNANVFNAGTVAPGDPQTMTINGNYTQLAGGILVLDVDGVASNDYDQLDVTGELSIEPGATLELDFGKGFAPTIGETFNLVDYGSLDPGNAAFTTVDITGLADGFLYAITPVGTDGTDFQLTALNDGISTTTPEPSTWVLLLAGMFLLGFVSRRMRRSTRPRFCL